MDLRLSVGAAGLLQHRGIRRSGGHALLRAIARPCASHPAWIHEEVIEALGLTFSFRRLDLCEHVHRKMRLRSLRLPSRDLTGPGLGKASVRSNDLPPQLRDGPVPQHVQPQPALLLRALSSEVVSMALLGRGSASEASQRTRSASASASIPGDLRALMADWASLRASAQQVPF